MGQKSASKSGDTDLPAKINKVPVSDEYLTNHYLFNDEITTSEGRKHFNYYDDLIICGFIKKINKNKLQLKISDIARIVAKYYNYWKLDWDENFDSPILFKDNIVGDDGTYGTNYKNVYSNCSFSRGIHNIKIHFIRGGWEHLRVGIVEKVLYDANTIVGDKSRNGNTVFGYFVVYCANNGCILKHGMGEVDMVNTFDDNDTITICLDLQANTVTFYHQSQKQGQSVDIKENTQYVVVVSYRSPDVQFRFE